ncbi:hypothetical protein BH24ACT7_BH24ACT7_10650 [soil metagenome]
MLAGAVAGGLFILGAGELITRLGEPLPLLFWLPTLWGGAALVFVGSFRVPRMRRLSWVLVIAGAMLGFVPSVWTIVMPALIITLVVRTISGPGRAATQPGGTA